MKKLLCAFAILFSLNAFASHVPGGQITYECVGPNQFKIILTLFEDCGTAFTGTTPETITISNDCGIPGYPTTTSATQTLYQQEVSQLCPTAASECTGGPYPGVWMHQYEAIVTLPASSACDSWHFSYTSCCRNLATNSTTYDSYYWEATVNTVDAPCNNSPQFMAAPIPYACVGSPVCYSFGVFEPDGDSISFAFVDALSTGPTFPITYVGGYTGAVPIPGITIDPVTGQITFTPTAAGNYIVAVMVTEYDAAGNVIGTVIRDIQFEIISCVNDIVDCSTAGSIPTSSIIGAVVQTGPTTLQMCEGVPFCFTVTFTDPDPADILTITSNASLVLPGSIVTTTSGNTATAQICWTPPAGSAGAYNSFSLLVADNACPVSGQQTIVYTMDVIGGTVANADLTICGSQTANLSVNGGSVFTWTALPGGDPIVVGSNFSCNPCQTPVATPSVTTTYVVTSDLTGTCDNVDTVTVFVVPDFQFLVTQSSPTSCILSDVFIATTITGGTGTGPFTYLWDPATNLSADNIPNPVFTATAPGGFDYVLTVENAFGCTYTDTISISVAPSYSPTVTASTTMDSIYCGDIVQLAVDLGGGIPATCGLSTSGGCAGPITNIQVGTFDTQNTTTTYPTPFGNWYANEKHHFLYTAAELNAMGFIGGKINSIGFNVITLGGMTTYPDYTVKIACTGLTSLPNTYGAPFSTPTFATVYGPANYTATVGTNTLNFTTPYEWDGSSNILVEVCYTWTAMYSYTTNCIMQLDNTTFTSSNWFNSDGTVACPNTTISGFANQRPVTYFNYCPADPDTTAYSYAWTPAGTVTSPGAMTTLADPCTSTNYQVVVTDLAGGCTDTAWVYVYVIPTCFPPEPTVTNVSCNGGTDGALHADILGTTGPFTVDWYQGATLIASHTGVVANDSLIGLPAGTYTIVNTDTTGCTDDTTVTITEPPLFTLTTSADDTICINGSFTFNATLAGGTVPYTIAWSGDFTGTTAGPHTVNPLGTENYIINATDANGCIADDDTVSVALYPAIVASTSGNVQLCMGSSSTVVASATGGMGAPYNFSWYNAASGTAMGTGSNLTITPGINNAQYCVIATDACTTPSDTACMISTFFPEPYPSISQDTSKGCIPFDVTFSVNTDPSLIHQINWNFGDGGTTTTVDNSDVTHSYSVSNTDCYDVYVLIESPNGCTHDTTYTDYVCALAYPTAGFNFQPQPADIMNTEVIFEDLSSPDVVNFEWFFYDSLNNLIGQSNLQNPVFEFPDHTSGIYPVWLFVTNSNGCVDSIQLNVVVIDIFTFYMPNSFTPDGNGHNDIFIPVGRNMDIEEYEFRIFNRWGELVFHTNDIFEGWDGLMNNIKAKEDVYVWKIKVKSALSRETIERTGHVTLMR